MMDAADEIQTSAPHEDISVEAGEGGTTFRFLTALAAARPGKTRIEMHERLRSRPHEPLFEGLAAGRRGGHTIRRGEPSGYRRRRVGASGPTTSG